MFRRHSGQCGAAEHLFDDSPVSWIAPPGSGWHTESGVLGSGKSNGNESCKQHGYDGSARRQDVVLSTGIGRPAFLRLSSPSI